MTNRIKLFYSYSHKDETFREELQTHLAVLRQDGLIDELYDRKIGAGDKLGEEIDKHMESAHVILLLFSPDFIASEACRREVETAMRLKDEKQIDVIPVILRDCAWRDTGVHDLLAIPEDGKPITNWDNRDKAWQDVYEKIRNKVISITSPVWINKLKINESPLFAENSKIELAKLTLIIGGNSSGKTALCEWFAGFSDPGYLERWAVYQEEGLHMVIEYNDPELHTFAVSIPLNKIPEYKLDETPSSLATLPLKTIFPRTITFGNYEEQDDIELISDAMNIHRYELQNLCEDRAIHESGFIKEICFEKDNERCYLLANLQSIKVNRPILLRLLSEAERYQLMIELGILAAKKFAEMSPTLLILDSGFWKLETKWHKHYTELLTSPAIKFQSVATIYPDEVNSDDSIWTEWSKVQLIGKPPNVGIRAV